MGNNLLLDLLAFGAVLSGVLVITAKNPVISVLFLISLFINIAGYLVLMGVAYLGLVYIIVYVGAIAILFLFVIIMLNLRIVELLDTGKAYTQNIPAGTILGALFFFELSLGITSQANSTYKDAGLFSIPATLYDTINNFFISFPLFKKGEGGIEEKISSLSDVILSESTYINNSMEEGIHITFNPYTADTFFVNSIQIQSIGQGLYTYSTLWLVIASFILLLSIVGPIILCINTPTSTTPYIKNNVSLGAGLLFINFSF